jgi:hypothetical protein
MYGCTISSSARMSWRGNPKKLPPKKASSTYLRPPLYFRYDEIISRTDSSDGSSGSALVIIAWLQNAH